MDKFNLKQYFKKNITVPRGMMIAGLLLLGYYFFQFGVESPWENLYGDYTSRSYNHPVFGRGRINVPMLPDKFVTLLALAGTFILLILIKLREMNIPPNPITRLLALAALLGQIPLGLYLLTYFSVLMFIGIIGFVIYYVFGWILNGSKMNKNIDK
ncbi:MAG: hypothetical protein MUE85_01815 [Microscillaceae bacterium]|jgi:hypothetical protein|nr:hypothetical protein [Microscillaceae bacterium]